MISDKELFVNNVTNILVNIGLMPNLISDTVSGLTAYYLSNGRYYHSIGHINDMLHKMSDAGWDDADLGFAILYHDVYYKIGARHGFNERISANIAEKTLHNCHNHHSLNVIINMIMATSNFMKTDKKLRIECRRICDLDLSSLARQPYEDFVDQQKDVLKEHKIDDLSKSASFLKELLKKRGDDLFYTEYAKDEWLQKSKDNISRFVEEYLN